MVSLFCSVFGRFGKIVAVLAISVHIVAFPSIGPELCISRYSRAKWGTWPDVIGLLACPKMSKLTFGAFVEIWRLLKPFCDLEISALCG